MKGSFDPSGGTKPEAISPELREELIASVTKYLDLEHSEDRRDFDEMMKEI
ncbi:MAG: hypothetical protein WBQ43_20405 [Terriglobales bacterium]